MPLLVGIDEAGYGPLLGPLVVASSSWRVPEALVDASLWGVLRGCVGRSGARGDAVLQVDDSKRVFNRERGISTLERPVLAFAQAAGLRCDTLEALLEALGSPAPEPPRRAPWEQRLDHPLPVGGPASACEHVAQRLVRTLARVSVVLDGLAAQVVAPHRFNQRLATTRNKAAVLLEPVLVLIEAALRRSTEPLACVRVDRLGGRADYRELLAQSFPQRRLEVLEQSESASRYHLRDGDSCWTIEFLVDGDRRHLPIALASMLAKYTRELLMDRFNAWWSERMPALKATAGYAADGQRFVREIEPLLDPLGLRREWVIRAR